MLLLSCGGSPVPLPAAPRWLTAVPRAVGRSYGNMFTFKQPWVAAQQWAQVGAIVLDQKTTQDVFHRCANCVELNLLAHNRRFGGWGAVGFGLLDVSAETTWTKYTSEVLQDDPSWYWRHAYSAFPLYTVGLHIGASAINMSNK